MSHEERVPSGSDLEAEFRRLVGFDLQPWAPNLLEEQEPFRNQVSAQLASWAFDYPERLPAMRAWARAHAERDPRPQTWELLGYFDYLLEDWSAAARAFMRSLEAEPRNLDAWIHLAFALKHAGLELGDSILYDHDLWIRLHSRSGGPLTLSRLYRYHGEVERSEECYRRTWAEHARPFLG